MSHKTDPDFKKYDSEKPKTWSGSKALLSKMMSDEPSKSVKVKLGKGNLIKKGGKELRSSHPWQGDTDRSSKPYTFKPRNS